jgi:hypothetical protein
MKFAIGDKVVDKTTVKAFTSHSVYEVVGVLDDSLLLKHWGDCFDGVLDHYDFLDKSPGTRGWREGILRYQDNELITTDEALKQLAVLENIQDLLDDDFEKVKSQFQQKINQAAAIVKEANELINPFDRVLSDLRDECMPLYLALHNGGWSHSHMSC